jgi:hypothetical protein
MLRNLSSVTNGEPDSWWDEGDILWAVDVDDTGTAYTYKVADDNMTALLQDEELPAL